MIAGTLEVQMTADLARLSSDMAKAKTIVGDATKQISEFAAGAKSALASLGVGLSGAAFANMVKGAIDAMDHLRDLSIITGIQVEELSKLKQVADLSGTSLDTVTMATEKLARNMSSSGTESTTAAGAMKFLGLSAKDAQGNLKPLDQMLQEIAVSLNKYQDGAGKIALAQDLMGKGAAQMLPFLKQLAETGTKNAEVTTEQAEAAHAFQVQLRLLHEASEEFWRHIASDALPKLTEMLRLFNELKKIGGFAAWLTTSGDESRNTFKAIDEYEAKLRALEKTQGELAKLNPFMQWVGDKGIVDAQIAAIQAKLRVLRGLASAEIQSLSPLTEPPGTKPTANYNRSDQASALAEMKLFTSALQRYEEELGRANQMSMAEKAIYELTAGSLQKLTMEHKAIILSVAGEIDDRKQLIETIDANTKAYAALYEAEQKQNEVQRAFRQQGLDAIDDLQFQNDLLGKTALEVMRLTEARRIEIAERNAERAAAEAAGDDYEAYVRLVKALREEMQRQKAATDDLVKANYELQRSFDFGLNKALQEYIEQAGNAAANAGMLVGTVFKGAEDVFVNFARTGKLEFKSFADSVIADLARIYFRMTVTVPAAKALKDFSDSSGGLGAGLLSLLGFGGSKSSSGSSNFSSVDSALSSDYIPRYASGTPFVPNDGLAYLHRGEAVVPANQNSWGGDVIINNNIDARGSDAGVEQRIEAAMERVKRSIVPIVADAKRRNAFGRVL